MLRALLSKFYIHTSDRFIYRLSVKSVFFENPKSCVIKPLLSLVRATQFNQLQIGAIATMRCDTLPNMDFLTASESISAADFLTPSTSNPYASDLN